MVYMATLFLAVLPFMPGSQSQLVARIHKRPGERSGTSTYFQLLIGQSCLYLSITIDKSKPSATHKLENLAIHIITIQALLSYDK